VTAAERIALRVPRDTFYLSLVRHAVTDLARRAGFLPAAVAEIEMAVDEACSNAVRHARGGRPLEGPAGPAPMGSAFYDAISVDAVGDPAGITVTIADGGEPFPFDRVGVEDLESYLATRQAGGLGVYIIRRFMDEVEYRHEPERGNELRMRKYLAGART
jgi:anti-sigma regulatory factor (Ser/Thr protein kinase)